MKENTLANRLAVDFSQNGCISILFICFWYRRIIQIHSKAYLTIFYIPFIYQRLRTELIIADVTFIRK